MKPLDNFLGELDQQVAEDLETPLDGIEEEYLLYHQMRFNWLSYRTAIKSNLNLFGPDVMDSVTPGRSLLRSWRKERHALDPNRSNINNASIEQDGDNTGAKRSMDVDENLDDPVKRPRMESQE